MRLIKAEEHLGRKNGFVVLLYLFILSPLLLSHIAQLTSIVQLSLHLHPDKSWTYNFSSDFPSFITLDLSIHSPTGCLCWNGFQESQTQNSPDGIYHLVPQPDPILYFYVGIDTSLL